MRKGIHIVNVIYEFIYKLRNSQVDLLFFSPKLCPKIHYYMYVNFSILTHYLIAFLKKTK